MAVYASILLIVLDLAAVPHAICRIVYKSRIGSASDVKESDFIVLA